MIEREMLYGVSLFCYTKAGGMKMHQSDYIRLVPGADTAVLFIHGIVGTPEHFIQLIPLTQLVPMNCSVYNMLLDGHGGTAKDFGKSSMEKWKRQVWAAFDILCRDHRQIVVVGHSMGSIFAVELAIAHPDRVKQLFLLAVPLRPKVGIRVIDSSLRLICGTLRGEIPEEKAMEIACGAEPTWKVWHYITWIPRFVELLVLVHKTVRVIDQMTVPCIAVQSARDELVHRSAWDILGRNRRIVRHMLPKSSHFYYDPEDKAWICEVFYGIMETLEQS